MGLLLYPPPRLHRARKIVKESYQPSSLISGEYTICTGMGSAFSRTSMGQRDLRFLRFTGLSAWIVWAAVHIYFLIGFANRFFVILQWGFTFLTKRRQVRVFPGQENAAKAP